MKFKMPKNIKIIVISAVSLAVLGGGGWYAKGHFFKPKVVAQTATASANIGVIENSISGSGLIEPNNKYEVTALAKGEIINAPFEEGDLVEEGALLYQIDTSDMMNSIEKQQLNLKNAETKYAQSLEKREKYQQKREQAQRKLDDANRKLSQAQDKYNQKYRDVEKLNVKSKFTGTIISLNYKRGDNAKSNSIVATVQDSSAMTLKIPFIKEDADSLYIGKQADVTLLSSNYSVSGSVSKITTGSSVSSLGVEVRIVEILVDNPGSIKGGDKATAIVGDVACNAAGSFDYKETGSILCEIDGTVETVYFNEGDHVNYGDIIMQLSSDTLEDSLKDLSNSITDAQNGIRDAENGIKDTETEINDTENSIKDSYSSIESQRLSLEGEQKKLDDYNITSPISGTVINKTSKKGDRIDSSTSQTVMATIADMSKIIFKMSVDELDIDKIEVGQAVTVTADALPDKVFEGIIDYKNIIGTSTNGVTSYPVTVVVIEPEGLIPGMNVNAKVIVDRKDNVLRIPVSALKRGNIVQVKLKEGETAPTADPNAKGPKIEAPAGFKNVVVKSGLNDKDNVEITEGLKEGDEVSIPVISATSTFPQMGMGGMGGMGAPMGGGGGNIRINTGGGGGGPRGNGG